MQSIQYVGEHIWIHHCGRALILFAFFSGIYTCIASYFCFIQKVDIDKNWVKARQLGFITHCISVFLIISLLFYIMSQHYYEFQYVWAHVSDELPQRYILSAFWEGQEGGFLLWIFWNTILCFFFFSAKNTINFHILAILLAAQVIMLSMLLGIYLDEIKIGSNPFVLLRQSMNIPLFKNAEYVHLLKGNGLNPLLQNYWMTIHPPTLFLGFASTIVPFAYSISAIRNNDFTNWLKPCLVWALFSACILGLGILMGAAWAYEALSFGGYWAWDPVENMSLVPWIILLAGIHSNFIAINTSYSIKATVLFYFLTFILVLYSSFLTRSGILGDSSVHSFTQMGLEWQLVLFILFFFVIGIWIIQNKANQIPTLDKEEQFASREFWMFIGSLVLLFSAMLITFTTSIPVYNKLVDLIGQIIHKDFSSLHKSPPVNTIGHHNKFQIWIAVLISLLSGLSLALRYSAHKLNASFKTAVKPLGISLIASLFLYSFSWRYYRDEHFYYHIYLFSAWFAMAASVISIMPFFKSNKKFISSLLAHAGFGILMLGILFTGLKRKFFNPASDDLASTNDKNKKSFLLIKNEAKRLDDYTLTYLSDTLVNRTRIYSINFTKNDLTESFTVYPEIQYDNKLSKVAASNPYSKHYLSKDIFTLVTQIPSVFTNVESAKATEDSLHYHRFFLSIPDTLITENNTYIFSENSNPKPNPNVNLLPGDKILSIKILAYNNKSKHKTTENNCSIHFSKQVNYNFPAIFESLGAKLKFSDSLLLNLATDSEDLIKQTIQLKQGESFELQNGKKITLCNISKSISNQSIDIYSTDLAVQANIVYNKDSLNPVFVVRDNKQFSIGDYILFPYLYVDFIKLDPENNKMTFNLTYCKKNEEKIVLDIAENAAKTDYIVMEAIDYPGINMVWLGSLLMILGLGLSSIFRKKISV